MKPPDELAARFRAQGRKVTPQRQRIFEVLHGADTHPTAEAVYEAIRADLPTVSLRTVYQTLNDLAAMGELRQIDLGTGSARFDPNLEPHQHLVCERCGAVHDVDVGWGDLPLPTDLEHDFVITTTDIVFRGRCATCAAAPDGSEVATDPGNPTKEATSHG